MSSNDQPALPPDIEANGSKFAQTMNGGSDNLLDSTRVPIDAQQSHAPMPDQLPTDAQGLQLPVSDQLKTDSSNLPKPRYSPINCRQLHFLVPVYHYGDNSCTDNQCKVSYNKKIVIGQLHMI
jgi:hypothetical protein